MFIFSMKKINQRRALFQIEISELKIWFRQENTPYEKRYSGITRQHVSLIQNRWCLIHNTT